MCEENVERNKLNIFVLDKDPIQAAKFSCDKLVIKMVLESTQLLCTAHNILDGEGIKRESRGELITLYKTTNKNHPCSIWVRKTSSNYKWLYDYSVELCKEYTRRYGKTHKCQIPLYLFLFNSPKNILEGDLTEFVQCMPDQYKNEDVVTAYRSYYLSEKKRFAKWKMGNIPEWWR